MPATSRFVPRPEEIQVEKAFERGNALVVPLKRKIHGKLGRKWAADALLLERTRTLGSKGQPLYRFSALTFLSNFEGERSREEITLHALPRQQDEPKICAALKKALGDAFVNVPMTEAEHQERMLDAVMDIRRRSERRKEGPDIGLKHGLQVRELETPGLTGFVLHGPAIVGERQQALGSARTVYGFYPFESAKGRGKGGGAEFKSRQLNAREKKAIQVEFGGIPVGFSEQSGALLLKRISKY